MNKKQRMSKKQKQHLSVAPGHGISARVVEKDINFALRIWKRKLKDSDVLVNLKEGRAFLKPSVKRRKQKIDAIYTQKIKELHADD